MKRLWLMSVFGAFLMQAPALAQGFIGIPPLHPVRGIKVHPKCVAGNEACPAALDAKPDGTTLIGTGSVSGEHPDYYFKFDAEAGQKATIHVQGGGIKTGAGIPIKLPDGSDDALDVDTPFTLPATGTYVLDLHANTMSEGPFGRFHVTLALQ